MNHLSYNSALKAFYSFDFTNCEEFFKSNDCYLQYGYCLLLQGDLETAKRFFFKIKDYNPRADWAIKLIQFMQGYVISLPSYFQIRNFLEIDLNWLLQLKQYNYVEYIINGANLFYSVNSESYKFIARVLINNGYYKMAKIYLDKAKDHLYFDPELHILYVYYYSHTGETQEALKSAKICLQILPDYFPAKKAMKEFTNQ